MGTPIRDVSERGLAWMGLLDGGFLLKARQLPKGPRVISANLAFYSPGHLVVKTHKLEVRMHATEMLRKHLALYCGTVHAYVRTVSQTDFDALVSFAYSIGERPFIDSPVLHRTKTGASRQSVAGAMGYYVNAVTIDGQVERDPKLVERRRAETYLYLNGLYRTP